MDKINFLKQYAKYTLNGNNYVEIGGVKWATKNVGAEKETDYGLYFQWGDAKGYTPDMCGLKNFSILDYKYWETIDGHPYHVKVTKYNEEDGKTVLDLSDDAARANWGGSWRTPTDEDFKALVKATTHEWVKNYKGSGVNGMLFTDKKDNTKKVFFPAAGKCGNSVFFGDASYGSYWSGSIGFDDIRGAFIMNIDSFMVRWEYSGYRHYGLSVRPVLGL